MLILNGAILKNNNSLTIRREVSLDQLPSGGFSEFFHACVNVTESGLYIQEIQVLEKSYLLLKVVFTVDGDEFSTPQIFTALPLRCFLVLPPVTKQPMLKPAFSSCAQLYWIYFRNNTKHTYTVFLNSISCWTLHWDQMFISDVMYTYMYNCSKININSHHYY